MNFVHSVDGIVIVRRVIVQNVSATRVAVLNAMDLLVVKIRESCPGDITLFSYDLTHPVIVAHRAQDKHVVFFDGTDIVDAKGTEEIHHIPVKHIPMTDQGLLPSMRLITLSCIKTNAGMAAKMAKC